MVDRHAVHCEDMVAYIKNSRLALLGYLAMNRMLANNGHR